MKKDLVVLVADRDMEFALKGLFTRPKALGIRSIVADILVHPQHDPACARHGVEFLSSLADRYCHGLLMFDHEGSGMERESAMEIQSTLNDHFVRSTWGGRAKAIVLSPELETWVWSDSPHVEEVVGWKDRRPALRSWLTDRGWLHANDVKPTRPKEALQAALRESRRPRSASLYEQIAARVSLQRCTDKPFQAFKALMQEWFPA